MERTHLISIPERAVMVPSLPIAMPPLVEGFPAHLERRFRQLDCAGLTLFGNPRSQSATHLCVSVVSS